MKKVYIAGPYSAFITGKDRGGNDVTTWDNEKVTDNIFSAMHVAIKLANEGIGFFCPHTHTANFHWTAEAPESFYKELDLDYVDLCDAVLAIQGWTTSKGSNLEVGRARSQGKPIFTYDMVDWLEKLKAWYFDGV